MVPDIVVTPGRQVVEGYDTVSSLEESIDEMRAYKPGPSGHQGMHSVGRTLRAPHVFRDLYSGDASCRPKDQPVTRAVLKTFRKSVSQL